MSEHLSAATLDWSLAHHKRFGDTDLFPRLFEFEVIEESWKKVRDEVRRLDLTEYSWSPPRRVLVPKDPLVFRSGAQLHPLDSLIYAAIIHEIGSLIEQRRRPVSKEQVFSARFDPNENGQLYSQADYWSSFWSKSLEHASAEDCTHVVLCDIADFYRQVDHALVRSQLELADVPTWYRIALANLLRVAAGDVGRGLPVGPHASHLLAELSLIPLDNMLSVSYPHFCRFVDDMHVFCGSEEEAEYAVYDIANVLDSTHLWASGRKTRIVPADEFREIARTNVQRGDLSDEEVRILEIVKEVAESPYTFASFDAVAEKDREALSEEILSDVLDDYVETQEPDYSKIRWFLRRLSQVEAPGAINFVVNNLQRLTPAMPDVVAYLRTAAPKFQGNWSHLGSELVEALEYGIVERSEYLQFVILSLFAQIADLNHFKVLAERYRGALSLSRREIILAARRSGAVGWLEGHASSIEGRGPWEMRAVLFAADSLPLASRKRILAQMGAEPPSLIDSVLLERLMAEKRVPADVRPRWDDKPADTADRVRVSLDVKRGTKEFDVRAFRRQMKELYKLDLKQSVKQAPVTLTGSTPLLDPLVRDALAGSIDARFRACGGVRLLNVRTRPGGEYVYDFVRQLSTKSKPLDSIGAAQAEEELALCDVLLVTTTTIEREVLLTYLEPSASGGKILEASVGRVTYRIGRLGRYRCAWVETRMGSQDPHGSALTLADAIHTVAPKAILIVGIAFGINRAKQRLGDVLVANSILPYELQKLGPDFSIQRGTEIPCGPTLSERFRTRATDWRFSRYDGQVGMWPGPVLSGEKLINNLEFRNQLVREYPTAVGGEMEGIGAYAAASRTSTEVILLKGICDWADGEKNDVAQPFAGHAAVSLARHVLSKADVLLAIGAREN